MSRRNLGIATPAEHFQVRFLQVAELTLDLIEAEAGTRLVPGELGKVPGNFPVRERCAMACVHLVNRVVDIGQA